MVDGMASGEKVPSAHSIKNPVGAMEVLPPEGSSVYITELRGSDSPPVQYKQITPTNSKTTLIGVPRKPSSQIIDEPSDSSDSSAPPSPRTVLRNAGVDIELDSLEPNGSSTPLELLSEFTSCVMRDEYEAAQLLCEKILEFEPSNETALEFLPVIKERLKLDDELSTEESSSESDSDCSEDSTSSETSSSDDSDIETVDISTHRHCIHHIHHSN